ncbi:unnamed protein product [Nezara viridula]|uniref:Tubulin polyglutamylase TTLL4-like n=1 Tax=Nezara viridula TaxID=85310 RepID=A0A9P0MXP2_NEZVI|nr:unnamed protein product [Nezara viridula]
MPAMATPFIVPKVALTSSSIVSEIEPQSSIAQHASTSSNAFGCNTWCKMCDVHLPTKAVPSPKRYYGADNFCSTEPLYNFDHSQVEFEAVKRTGFKSDKVSRESGKAQKLSKVSACSDNFRKTSNPKSTLPERAHHENYLKEVEALRGKLRELKGTATAPVQHRRLPEIPREVSSNSQSRQVRQSVVNKLHQILDTNKSLPTSETKRNREISDSDCSIPSGTVYTTPKRPRDVSPKDIVNHFPEKSNPSPLPPKKEVWNEVLNDDVHSKVVDSSCDSDDDEDWYLEGKTTNDLEKKLSSDGCTLTTLQQAFLHYPAHIAPRSDLVKYSSIKAEDKKVHPCLRPSLFANTPPYIRFATETTKADKPFPVIIQRTLKWKLTTVTPIIVKKIIQNSGYKFIRRTPDWVGIWGKHMKSVVFRTLKENQKLNHFPGTFQIGRKDRLWRNLQRHMSKHGKKEFGFMPRTYVLPQDIKSLRASWDKQDNTRWIVKPPASARGSGIKVVNKWVDIPKKIPLIVQKYISNPYLINGNKFDLRLYVLVTSFDPLRIYIYDNGLVRFASARYTDDLKTLNDRYIHLTNYSINKFSQSYSLNEDAGACTGHKWTLRSLWSFLDGTINIDALWSSLIDLVIKTMISGENPISQMSRVNLTSRYCSYELFGVDVLLDENLKPWLLEVNISPSLHSGSTLDTAVKGPLVTNIFNLVGYHIPNTLSQAQEVEASAKMGIRGPLCIDHRMYMIGLSQKEKDKHAHFSSLEDREMYLDSILEDLTPDDVRHLVQYEDELTQTGNFQRIFPTSKTFPYHKFLEGECYYNRLMDAWEYKYSRRREEGIDVLRSLCVREVHLDVRDVEPRSANVCLTETSSFELVPVKKSDSGSGSDTAKKSDESKATPVQHMSRSPKYSISKPRSARSLAVKLRRVTSKYKNVPISLK